MQSPNHIKRSLQTSAGLNGGTPNKLNVMSISDNLNIKFKCDIAIVKTFYQFNQQPNHV
jgi:hypothetical protein